MLPVVAVALALVAASAPAAGAASRRVPFGWLGTMVDGPLIEPGGPLEREIALMARSGVERVRVAFYWDQAQPWRRAADVPPYAGPTTPVAGVPTDFAATDALVAAAAARRLEVLPVIVRAPAWARRDPAREWSPPAQPRAYANFAAGLVRRYGPRGTFWPAHPSLPRVPIRAWQVWNEPAGYSRGYDSPFWDDPGQPYVPRYVALLRAARRAIKAADPHAAVVLASLTGRSWDAVYDLVRGGARGLFDAVGANIYARNVSDMVRVIQNLRQSMHAAGVAHVPPVLVTELTWTASKGKAFGNNAVADSRADQARRLRAAVLALAQRRRALRIAGVFWYTWLSSYRGNQQFAYAGLRRTTAHGGAASLPALRAYRTLARGLEGCAKRASARCR
jgi:hypothetical protein